MANTHIPNAGVPSIPNISNFDEPSLPHLPKFPLPTFHIPTFPLPYVPNPSFPTAIPHLSNLPPQTLSATKFPFATSSTTGLFLATSSASINPSQTFPAQASPTSGYNFAHPSNGDLNSDSGALTIDLPAVHQPANLPVYALVVAGIFTFLGLLVFSRLLYEVLKELKLVFMLWIRRYQPGPYDEENDLNGTPSAGQVDTHPGRFGGPLEYNALNIDEFSIEDLKDGASRTTLLRKSTPIARSAELAILSWRWDFDRDGRSRNVAAAIKYAKSAGIKYLLVDCVAINQNEAPSQLIDHVVEFSKLYRRVPVIAAYDLDVHAYEFTPLRPWIFHELWLMSENTNRMVYVGHNKQGAWNPNSLFCLFFRRPLRSLGKSSNIGKAIKASSNASYVTPILNILNGTIRMQQIRDFQYIIPELFDLRFDLARLQHNDYLLTIALLLQCHSTPAYQLQLEAWDRFAKVSYEQYAIETEKWTDRWARGPTNRRLTILGPIFEEEDAPQYHPRTHTVYVKVENSTGEKVATFRYRGPDKERTNMCTYSLEVEQTAWNTITTVLSISGADQAVDRLQARPRHTPLRVNRLEVVEVKL